MPRLFSVTYSNTGRNSALGLNIHHATMTDNDVLRIATAEARRRGTTLEALAGIRKRMNNGSQHSWVRPITSREALAVALEKLSDDGRVLEIAEITAKPALGSPGGNHGAAMSADPHERLGARNWALDALRLHFHLGEADDIVAIRHGVHDSTRCGARVDVNEAGEITLAFMTKGHNPDFTCHPIATRGRLQEEISADIVEALQWLEAKASAV